MRTIFLPSKQNKTEQNKTKQNKTKQNKTKNKIKQNKTKTKTTKQTNKTTTTTTKTQLQTYWVIKILYHQEVITVYCDNLLISQVTFQPLFYEYLYL